MHPFPAGRCGQHPITTQRLGAVTLGTFIKSLLAAVGNLRVLSPVCPSGSDRGADDRRALITAHLISPASAVVACRLYVL